MRRLMFILFLYTLWSNSVALASDSLFFSTLSIRDGLPSNIISAITQDKKDFIWIGTANGLARYDGYRFITFKKGEPHSLPANEISSLLIEGDFIWVGTWKGLCKINTLSFKIEPVDLGNNKIIRTLYKDKLGNVWIGTATGLVRYSNGTFEEFNTQNSNLSHNTVRSIFEDKFGNLWVGTYDKLNKLSPGQKKFVTFNLKGNYKTSLKNNLVVDIKSSILSDSVLWVGTETGLCELNVFTGKFLHHTEKSAAFSNEVVKNIYIASNGKLWLGTDFGLNIFNPKTSTNKVLFHNPQLSYSIANNVISQIYEDAGGVLWFVTANGLSRLSKPGNYYTYHPVSHEFNGQTIGNQVKSALITSKGITWLATLHGVIRVDPATDEREIFSTQSAGERRILLNNVYALEEDNYGRIWIGTAGGINIWDEAVQKMYAITSNPTNGLITNYIARFTKGTDGSFWVSAWEGGLFKVTGDMRDIASLRFELVGDFGSEKNVSGANAIWAINYNELYRIDLQSFRNTKVPAFSTISDKRDITCLYYSRKGSLWAGTLNGLIEYKPQSDTAIFHPMITGNDITLASITEDQYGNMWGAAGGFILKFDVADRQTKVFPLDKEIPLKSFFDGCFATAANGDIIFGGDNGYISFSPDAKPNLYQPKVYVTSLEISNKKIASGEVINGTTVLHQDIAFTPDITLKYAQRSLAVEFSALHYWQPSMNIYTYKLEGFDTGWNYVSGTKNFAVYSNLSPGTYKLVVRGTNNYGLWSDEVAALQIEVMPPLFLSTGFLILYAVIVIAIAYLALRFYSTKLHWRNEVKIIRMEKEHAEEIALTKQQFFTNISHELRTPISLILPPIQQTLKRENLDEESRSLLKLAEKNSLRLLRVVNQILDYRKLEHDNLELKITAFDIVNFCNDLYSLFSDKATRKQIHFTFHAAVDECKIWADTEKVETILYNLLSNAFKFTAAEGSIDLSIKQVGPDLKFSRGAIEIKVTDTGIGIAPEDQAKIFDRFYQAPQAKNIEAGSGIGLTLAAEYVKLHHGKITVESELGKGSRFSVWLPLGNIHFPVTDETTSLNLVATKTSHGETEDQKTYLYNLDSDKPLILIVEDNHDMIDFLRINLKAQYNLIIAEDGEEALAKVNSFLPEIIVSDIMMPVMDGLTLCARIKGNHKTSHIGIILLTAKSLTSQKIEGIRMGADVYLTKPFEVELLQASIDHLLKRKQELSSYFKSEIITQPLPGTKENVDDKFIRKVVNIIEANISNPALSVEMISEEIAMSPTHLYRKLKSLTQFSAKDVIKKYRLKKASLLLKNKEGNISEIMYEVGFSNLSYFAKCFKAEFGISPKEYQQRESKHSFDIPENLKP